MKVVNTQEIQAQFLHKVFQYEPECFIEVGCFEGTASKTVKSKMPSCNVTAYEADPRNYIYFHSSLKDAGVHHVWGAVSNYNGTADFKIQSVPGKMERLWGNNSLSARNDNYTQYVDFPVRVKSLDVLHSDVSSACIWIDAEGCAYEVLQGAEKLLERTQCMLIEVEAIQHWENQKVDCDVIALLQSKGFEVIVRDQEYPEQYNILVEKV